MLTTPVFRPWRPLWDPLLGDATLRLDELAKERQKGRQLPPQVDNWSDVQHLIHALYLAQGRVSSSEFFEQKIEPLLKACVWPRWLLLEEALEHAANSGDLHLSALILRSQIEELDVLRGVARMVSRREEGAWNGDVMVNTLRPLMNRVLPRLQTKTEEQLVGQVSNAELAETRPEPLQTVFERLSEYVHPNHDSHVLSIRPHTVEPAKVFIEAFVTIYEVFLSLPWAKDLSASSEKRAPLGKVDSRDPYLILADETIPNMKSALPAVGDKKWDDVARCFRRCAACDKKWGDIDDSLTDIQAIHALNMRSVPPNYWPDSLRTVSGKKRYATLVAQEYRLAQDASHLIAGTVKRVDKERLFILASGLNFAINLMEYKLDSLARQAAHLINEENLLGATLAIRSMLEHHAVAVELGEKLRLLWQRAEKGAPNATKVDDALAAAEKQIARVLAGSSQPSGVSSSWRTLWQKIIRTPYNVLGPVKALDAKEPGFLKIYGLLSHIIHGTVGTGGDLLGAGGTGWRADHRKLVAQLPIFLANLCEFDAMLDRQASSMTIGIRLDVVLNAPNQTGERIKEMRLLKGQKLKSNRDIFGSGTTSDPYLFRSGLFYHDAYYQYLAQEGIQVRDRKLEHLSKGFADRVTAEDGRVLYFLNDTLYVK